MLDLATLNENQVLAVKWGDGPLLVLAGPGSGKTRVLTYRIARLLLESPDERYKVLGVTFTNKAAAEMRERLDGLVTGSRERLLITTFHSFAADLLRQHGSHVGLKPDFTILSQPADREAVLNDVIRERGIGRDETMGDAARVLPAIDSILDQMVAEGGAKSASPELQEMADAYVQRLVTANQLDFASLLLVAIRLLREKPFIAQQVRRVYKYVCVDEFQDTNAAQYELLRLVVPQASPNLFIVADDDQIIYQWNGASPQRLKAIRQQFNMTVVQLPENYRCPSAVIAKANQLIQHNKDRAQDKLPLVAHKQGDADDAVMVMDFDSADDESVWIAEELKALKPAERSRCAVLARTRKLLEGVIRAADTRGVPVYLASRKTEFETAPVKWMHSLLRLANSRQDREFLRRICKAFYEFEGVELGSDSIIAAAPKFGGDHARAWLEMTLATPRVSAATKKFLKDAVRGLVERNEFVPFMDAAMRWFSSAEFVAATSANVSEEYLNEEVGTWGALRHDIGTKFGDEAFSLNAFLQELDLCSKEPPPPKNAVRCLTIHSSKGMEFETVYLIGLAEEILPSWASIKKGEQSAEMREERRNCFVAITRAERLLVLTYARQYNGYRKLPSRFLREMGLV